VEDVILNRRDDATERLLDFAENVDVRGTEKRFKNGVQEQFRKD
jgi:5-methyltetrahydrofolate--homocysteine methyltransferase